MKVNLTRQVFNKNLFNKTIETEFNELKPPLNPAFFDVNLATINDFFKIYENLFFDISKSGSSLSHEFLVKESGDYINLKQNNQEIEALMEEIISLRQKNLELLEANITP